MNWDHPDIKEMQYEREEALRLALYDERSHGSGDMRRIRRKLYFLEIITPDLRKRSVPARKAIKLLKERGWWQVYLDDLPDGHRLKRAYLRKTYN